MKAGRRGKIARGQCRVLREGIYDWGVGDIEKKERERMGTNV